MPITKIGCMKKALLLFITFSLFHLLQAQRQELTYFLPNITYDAKIPTPEAFLGFQIGEWHVTHDQQVAYLRKLSELSPRFRLTEYARTYEMRPLIYLTITAEKNHSNLADLKAKHLQVSNPAESSKADLNAAPLVVWQGFSIHGNEPSGGNAAMLMAYYLAAGQSPELEQLLNNTIILFDPCFNPDGFQRFSTWANQHRNRHLTGDPADREFSETWPGGRFNHYWFDLNRDWLMGAHPESRGRAKIFQEWKPNILTDHHEMGTNASFFFMPGVPTRVSQIPPKQNQELTAKIGNFHAKALDQIGSLYYTQEGFDDFYIGKGSTYPDFQGCIGILFEQASSRGHLQESTNGPLTFAFTIRNQVKTALSTHAAAVAMKQELLEHQRDFYQSAIQEAKNDSRLGYVFGDDYDPARLDRFVEILRRQQVEVHELSGSVTTEGKTFNPGAAFFVPMEQNQYRLVRGIFETGKTFIDSIFYDISSWTVPMAFNLQYAAVAKKGAENGKLMGKKVEGAQVERAKPAAPALSNYAYLLEWEHYYAPRALTHLQAKGLRTKVATQPFKLGNKSYPQGTVLVGVQNQNLGAAEIHKLVGEITAELGVKFNSVETGLTPSGIDLGSNNFLTLRQPKVMIVVGETTGSNTAGEAWHLLDTRFDMTVSKVEADDIARANLSRYNVIVLGDGTFGAIGNAGAAKLKEWVAAGGTIVAIQRAANWLKNQGIGYVEMREMKDSNNKGRLPYGGLMDDLGAQENPGAIFEAELDLTHPLAYGYRNAKMPVFRDGEMFLEKGKNPYSTPLLYASNPLLSGYMHRKWNEVVKSTAGIVVSGQGQGRVIFMADNPNFRAHWYGTNRLFLNAVFFGNLISGAALEQEQKK
jgi:hypothetical protein